LFTDPKILLVESKCKEE